MINRFMLKNAKEVFETSCNNHFKRYDLSKEWSQFSNQINFYIKELGREPFIYELIEKLLTDLETSIKNQVIKVLHQKDYNWFIKKGQYLFYNYFQWINSYRTKDHYTSNEFLQLWWSKFLEFEGYNEVTQKASIFPNKILLELTNNCNLNCIMCGIGKNGYNSARNLPLELLHALSERVLPNAELIRINGLGESTILPNFLEYLDILSDLPAQLEIVTNLTVTSTKIWDKLLENHTNFLISCDSSSSQLFESIRRGASFRNFKNNLKYIGNNISNPIQGQIIFTLMESNITEISKVVDLAAEMSLGGVIVNVVKENSYQNDWMNKKYKNIIEQFQKAHRLANAYNIILKLPDHLGKIPVNKNISNPSCNLCCNNPWEEVYIRYNGDLTVCNMLNPYIYGNCLNKSFEEIWNGLN